jgi:beta-glucanase (GH16 family)
VGICERRRRRRWRSRPPPEGHRGSKRPPISVAVCVAVEDNEASQLAATPEQGVLANSYEGREFDEKRRHIFDEAFFPGVSRGMFSPRRRIVNSYLGTAKEPEALRRRASLVLGDQSWPILNLCAAILCIVLGCGKDATTSEIAPPVSSQSPWRLVWAEEFDGLAGAALDTASWIYDVGTGYPGGPPAFGTGEVERMTSDVANVSLDGAGHLHITPIRSIDGSWTSGRVETRRSDFGAPAGGALGIEASLQLPDVGTDNGLGIWPAFWLLGDGFRGNYRNWPAIGELDVAESVNARGLFFTLHCGTAVGGACKEPIGLSSGELACVNCRKGFHVYRVELDRTVSPEDIRFYVDGAERFEVRQADVDNQSWDAALHHGFLILLDVAIGGAFPAAFGGGPTTATVSGAPMLVDYVRVYQR